MDALRQGLPLIKPQLQLTLFGIGILLTDFFLEQRFKFLNAWVAMAGVAFSAVELWRLRGVEAPGFNGSIQVDSFFVYFGFLFLAATALVILISVRYLEIEHEHHGEYYALMLFATVGMMFMASGYDLVTLFISLETMALSFYILAGFLRNERRSNEGALKYLLLGAFSSGILAYGFSVLYGLSGSTNLGDIANAIALRPAGDILVLLALVTVSAGLFFKIAAVPFHQWAPDVYEGAPTSITAYVSVASKAASFALLMRLFLVPFWPVRANWETLLGVIAVATMTVGNFAAITQTNIKRLLAYSSIAHVGYILLGLVALNDTGLKGVAFYLFAYTFMNIGAFAVIILLRRKGLIGDELEDMNGLIHRNPGAAVLMLIFLLSLAGIPPTAGFMGKWLIFWGLIQTGHYYLAVFAALYILPAAYYYLRIVVHMWMTDVTDPVRPTISPAQWVALVAAVTIVLGAGLYPEPFLRLAAYSVILPLAR
ncbi:MAG: NADH-quinone oxidoreductase subunit N [Acidobacteria bacterium]|nr:NADH-quinone oxidoreductase subunit N [Acidobacteriota bacterium]MBI3662472.1 NADH-quinone oxidoreductase subunit N [Acidobacteriota bacterium]